MKSRHGSFHRALTPLVLLAGLTPSDPAAVAEPTQARAHVQAAMQHIPLYFEANHGQTDRRVQFLARGQSYSLFLTSKEAVLVLHKAEGKQKARTRATGSAEARKAIPQSSSVLRMKLLGANPHPKASGQERLPGQVNYFLGNNPKQWRTNVRTYAKVHYEGAYRGIDLVYYGNQQQLEYDFIVQPGANPRKIALAFEGAQRVRIDKSGELVLQTRGGEVRWHKPVVYQQVNGKRRAIAAKYTLVPSPIAQIGFQVARYDRTRPLVIDPVLAYSTYLGGSDGDFGNSIAVDSAGYVYVAGTTYSTDFPTKNAYQDHIQNDSRAFVTKLDMTKSGGASLLYSTYLGGSDGGDAGSGIAVDSVGHVYVTGTTGSPDFPTRNAYQNHYGSVFVTKLDTIQSGAASLLYSTYLGGSDGSDYVRGIAVDAASRVYVTGETFSTDFPTRNAYQAGRQGIYSDAFVTKLDTNQSGAASLLYSTYLGGSYGNDEGDSIAADAAGNVYVTGVTHSNDFPTRNAYQGNFQGLDNAFVTKLDTTKTGAESLLYSTYLGSYGRNDYGSNRGYGIAVDGAGYVYVTGWTTSIAFPTKNAYQGEWHGVTDTFVTKLDTTKSGAASLLYSTYLGGISNDEAYSIAVGAAGHVYVMGTTASSDFPTKNAQQAYHHGGDWDAFVIELDTTQSGAVSLVYSTYLGGSARDFNGGIAVDGAGNVYVSGMTSSTDFPTWNTFQGELQGWADAFVTKFAPGVTNATVSGMISLEDCVNPAQPVTFTLRPTDGTPAFSRTLTLNADGTFILTNLLHKNYQLAIKGSKWLQKVVSVDVSNGNINNVTALLKAGDANNDNLVSVDDLGALIAAFDADPSSPNWNGGVADFDCNDIVDVEDLDILIRNFDAEGDP